MLSRFRACFLPFLLILMASGPWPSAVAQEGPALGEESTLTIDFLEERADAVQADPALTDAARTRLRDLYDQAIAELRRAEDLAGSARFYEQQRQTASEDLAKIQQELKKLSATKVEVEPKKDSTVSDLDSGHIQAQVDLVDYESQLQQHKDEDARRTERRRQIPEEIAKKRAQLTALQPQAPAPGAAAAESEATSYLLQAQREALGNEIEALLNELLSYEARKRVLPRKIDLAALQVRQQEERVQDWLDLANRARQREARLAAEEAEETLIGASKEGTQVRAIAEQVASDNAKAVAERTETGGIVERIEDTQSRLAELQTRQSKLSDAYKELQTQTNQAESRQAMLTEPLGRVLRKRRQELPDERLFRKAARRTDRLLAETEARIVDLQSDRNALADIDGLVDDDIGEADLQDDQQRQDMRSVLVPLYESKRESVQALLEDYRVYAGLLATLSEAQRRLANLAEEMRSYIDERVLWIRSGGRVAPHDLRGIADGVQWLFSPTAWRDLLVGLRADFTTAPQAYLMPSLLVLVLIALRRRMRRRVATLEKAAAKRTCESIIPTLEALVHATLLPLPGILVAVVLAWRISVAEGVTAHGLAVGAGVWALAVIAATVAFPRQVLRRHGLGPVHFGWPEAACMRLRRSILTVGVSLAPIAFLVAALNASTSTEHVQIAARDFYLLGLAILAVTAYPCIRPSRGALWEVLAQNSLSPIRRSTRVLTAVQWAVMLSLFVAAAWGYYYTAQRLTGQLHLSFVFALLVYLVHSVALRWLLTSRRHLAITQARQRREQLKKEGAETGEETSPEAPQIDLAQVDTQTRRLLRSAMVLALVLGLWGIWSAEVPALGIFDSMELWHVSETVTKQVPNDAGEMQDVTETVLVPITWGNLFLAVFIGIIGIVLTQNIPGLLEIVLSRRLKLAHGERVAVTTIARYVITATAIVMSFNAIGIGWGKVQWLVAALSLGLGFGLQEIFANFVSGIILLFERPIRVGDTVTIGDISGNVTRIQIRATTITDWDRKELIVPNREFITGQLINWSLSDAVLRAVISVGVDYDSDVQLVEDTLYRLASENPHVLSDPAPSVYFKNFGDSTLDFDLRVYCGSIDSFLPVRHELHKAITNAFREAGITIAFPQRDLHIINSGGLKDALQPPAAE